MKVENEFNKIKKKTNSFILYLQHYLSLEYVRKLRRNAVLSNDVN